MKAHIAPPFNNTRYITDDHGRPIATLQFATDTLDTAGINRTAELFAAAPDLRAALDRIVVYLADLNGCDWIPGLGPGSVDMRQRGKAAQRAALAALAKAKGE